MRRFEKPRVLQVASSDLTISKVLLSLIDELRERFCIVIVTHSMAQAARVSQRTAFFHMGRLVETGDTEDIFQNPRERRTLDYITGRFG